MQYNEKHQSLAIVVKFKLSQIPDALKSYANEIYALIWTTTPWTLPSNQAICFNPNLSYSLIELDKSKEKKEYYIAATRLINDIASGLTFLNLHEFPGIFFYLIMMKLNRIYIETTGRINKCRENIRLSKKAVYFT